MKKMLLFVAAAMLVSATINGQVVKKFVQDDIAPEGPAPGTIWDAGNGCSLFFWDENGEVKANTPITIGSEVFDVSCQGKNNPKPWDQPDVGNGAMWLFDVTTDGKLEIAIAINKTKRTYLAITPIVPDKADYCYELCGEDGVTDYRYSNETQMRENATFYPGITGDTAQVIWPDLVTEDTWIYIPLTLNVEAGKCYNIFCTGSKATMYGFIFTPGATGLDGVTVNRSLVSTTYYNLAGQEVKGVNLGSKKGVYLVKNVLSDGTVDVQKLMIR